MNGLALLSDRADVDAYLQGRINYERDAAVPYRERTYKLDRMRELLHRLGDPHLAIPAVHIAGTKGKGSTSSLIAAALTAAGYRTGLYQSPHLERVEERMLVDGDMCRSDDLARGLARLAPIVEAMDRAAAKLDPPEYGPTYFEVTTALAWLYFVERRVEVAVLEVGLGGRLDSTNVCQPAVTVVTNISLDHTRQLGSTLAAIAAEKAGIFKPGVSAISGVLAPEARTVIEATAAQVDAPLESLERDFNFRYRPQVAASPADPSEAASDFAGWGEIDFFRLGPGPVPVLDRLAIGLPGRHQGANAALAVAALLRLREMGWRLPDEAIRSGLRTARIPARVEVVKRSPLTILDTAHNVASIIALLDACDEHFPGRPRRIVFSASKDKDVRGMLCTLLPRCRQLVLTQFGNQPRAFELDALVALACEVETELRNAFPHRSGAEIVGETPSSAAWKRVLREAAPGDLLCVTGSFFLAGELRSLVGGG